jgi:hypothetical protein
MEEQQLNAKDLSNAIGFDYTSEHVRNFIIYSYIKDFVEYLSETFSDDEKLSAYYNSMLECNVVLSDDTKEYVLSFESALNGKHRAKYCEGIYVNIPKYIKKDERANELFESIKAVYEDVTTCKELQFWKQYTEKKPSSNIPDVTEDNIKSILETIKPDIEKTRDDFYDQKLNLDRFVKMLMVGVYYKLIDMADSIGDDIGPMKRIIEIIVNNPLKALDKHKSELFMEFVKIKNVSNLKIPGL